MDDNKYIILILIFLGTAGILFRIPQLNPPDMWSKEISFKGALRLFLIALGAFIIMMIIGVGVLTYGF